VRPTRLRGEINEDAAVWIQTASATSLGDALAIRSLDVEDIETAADRGGNE
jgi:hypothetical protein